MRTHPPTSNFSATIPRLSLFLIGFSEALTCSPTALDLTIGVTEFEPAISFSQNKRIYWLVTRGRALFAIEGKSTTIPRFFPQRLVRPGDICVSFCFAQLSPSVPCDITSFRRGVFPGRILELYTSTLPLASLKGCLPSNLSPHTFGTPGVIRLLRLAEPGPDWPRSVGALLTPILHSLPNSFYLLPLAC